jgi:hypothetical protein
MRLRLRLLAVLFTFGAMLMAPAAHAYSLLTHEQLIDLTWERSIVPLLRSRYPNLTPAQLEEARAYAYGGCVIQDIGYYPFGDPFFSNLTHYVRSGDFVVNLFRNASNADELAFAVGALSHYMGDTIGHAEATNVAVPVEFPKLRAKYGNSVNYAQGEHQHVQTEFAFDIDQIAQHRFAPVHYLRHVGLKVPTKQLALAFYQTYGLGEDFSQHRSRRINVRGYRFAVRNFIPRIAYAVTLLHRAHETPDLPTPELLRMQQEVQQVAIANHWDVYRKKPGIGTYMLAGVIYVIPKVGPLKLAAVKGPTAQTEVHYVHSVLATTDALARALHRFTPPPATSLAAADLHVEQPSAAPKTAAALQGTTATGATGTGSTTLTAEATEEPISGPVVHPAPPDPAHPLPNRDLDTGSLVRPAGYPLTDSTYAALLHRLTEPSVHSVPPGVRAEIQAYYSDMSLPFATKKNPTKWAEVQHDLATLAALPVGQNDAVFATYGDE